MELAQTLIGTSAQSPLPVPLVRVIVIRTQNVKTLSFVVRTTVETSTQMLNRLQIVVFHLVRIFIVAHRMPCDQPANVSSSFSYFFLLPKSVRWLVQKGRHREAHAAIVKVAKGNSKDEIAQGELQLYR